LVSNPREIAAPCGFSASVSPMRSQLTRTGPALIEPSRWIYLFGKWTKTGCSDRCLQSRGFGKLNKRFCSGLPLASGVKLSASQVCIDSMGSPHTALARDKPLIRSALYGTSSQFSFPPSRFPTLRDGRSPRRKRASTRSNPQKPLKIMMKSAWGSDDPTKAAFPFSHGLALAEAGHEVQIFLLGEAVVLMRKVVAEAVTPVGWPKIADTGQTRGQAHSDLCLRRLFPRSWRNRGRSQQLWSEVRKSHNLCFSGGMVRQSDYRIVARSSAISPGPHPDFKQCTRTTGTVCSCCDLPALCCHGIKRAK